MAASETGTRIKQERITRILTELEEGPFDYNELSTKTGIGRPSLQSLMLPLIAEGKILRISKGNSAKFILPEKK